MDKINVLPDTKIKDAGEISKKFLELGVATFQEAAKYLLNLKYGYNSNKDDKFILFKEQMGTCSTKHSTFAYLAEEQNIPVHKTICLYHFCEEIVEGANNILEEFNLECLPMAHCFLQYQDYKIDLTEGNNNGKKRSIEDFLFTKVVNPGLTSKEEYLIYRNYLQEKYQDEDELKRMIKAHEFAIKLLKKILK